MSAGNISGRVACGPYEQIRVTTEKKSLKAVPLTMKPSQRRTLLGLALVVTLAPSAFTQNLSGAAGSLERTVLPIAVWDFVAAEAGQDRRSFWVARRNP